MKVRSFREIQEALLIEPRPICLFSGGLDGAYLLAKLSKMPGVKPIALSAHLGGENDLGRAREVADYFGVEFVGIEAEEEFCETQALSALWAQARYLDSHPISASLSRPLLAKFAVDLARKRGSQMILHTANTSQNSLRRFNGALKGLGYDGIYGTPYELDPVTREDKIKELTRLGVLHYRARSQSTDCNAWCREFESGDLDNPENFSWPEAQFKWTAEQPAPDRMNLTVSFNEGIPSIKDWNERTLAATIARLNLEAGKMKIGRFAALEELECGTKFLEIREAPAAAVLMEAFRRVETAVHSAETLMQKIQLEQVWVREAVEGRWYQPLWRAAQGFFASLATQVTGEVTLELSRGRMELRRLEARRPLYGSSRDELEKVRVAPSQFRKQAA